MRNMNYFEVKRVKSKFDMCSGNWKLIILLIMILFAIPSVLKICRSSVITANAETASKETHTVTFHPEGGTVDITSLSVVHGERIGPLPTPVRPGCRFLFWNTYEPDPYTGKYVFTPIAEYTVIRSDVDLYATWSEVSYSLYIDFNGGSYLGNKYSSKVVYYKLPVGALPTPERDGYQFLGFYTERSGGSKITESTVFDPSVHFTCYAHWKPRQYTITFNANGGKKLPASKSKKTLTIGQTYGTLPSTTRTGYRFQYWFYKDGSGNDVKISKNTRFSTTRSNKIYARWKIIQVRATFIPGGGNYPRIYKTLTYGKTVPLTRQQYFYPTERDRLLNPVRNGYIFKGWRIGSTRGQKLSFSMKSRCTKNVVIYGTWQKANEDQIARYIASMAKKKNGAYNEIREATHLVRLYVYLSTYSYAPGYNMPRGLFITGKVTCAGTVRGLGLVLSKMGYKWKHVNPNKYTHQWNLVSLPGRDLIADASLGGVYYR